MRATIKDVARAVGVSPAAVSRHLNRDPRLSLSDTTRARIDAVVRELDYRPSTAARALREGRSRMVGLVIGGLTDAFSSHLAELCLYYCDRLGYQLLISPVIWGVEQEKRALVNLLERRVDGIVFSSPLAEFPTLLSMLEETRTPLLLLNQPSREFLSLRLDRERAYRDTAACFARRGHAAAEECRHTSTDQPELFRETAEDVLRVRTVSIDTIRDMDRYLDGVLHRRPSALFLHNCVVARRLLERVRRERLDYRPDIVTIYNLEVDFIEDEAIVGIIHGDFYRMLDLGLGRLLGHIADASPSAESLWHPARFYPQEEFLAVRGSLIDSLERYGTNPVPAGKTMA